MFPLKNTTFFNLSLNVEDSRLFIVLVLLQDNKGTKIFWRWFSKRLVCSPQVFWAKLWLQELEEELLSHGVLQGLVQRETPLLYALLTGFLTGRNGRRWRDAVKTSTWSFCREVTIKEIRRDFITGKWWRKAQCGEGGWQMNTEEGIKHET